MKTFEYHKQSFICSQNLQLALSLLLYWNNIWLQLSLNVGEIWIWTSQLGSFCFFFACGIASIYHVYCCTSATWLLTLERKRFSKCWNDMVTLPTYSQNILTILGKSEKQLWWFYIITTYSSFLHLLGFILLRENLSKGNNPQEVYVWNRIILFLTISWWAHHLEELGVNDTCPEMWKWNGVAQRLGSKVQTWFLQIMPIKNSQIERHTCRFFFPA